MPGNMYAKLYVRLDRTLLNPPFYVRPAPGYAGYKWLDTYLYVG